MKTPLIRSILSALTFTALSLPAAFAQTTERVSVDSAGLEGNHISDKPSISADGRFVAFESFATNLVPSDTNITWDVFVHDHQTGQTRRVSVDSVGLQGNAQSYGAAISADGRYVGFSSWADNLVPGNNHYNGNIFVHDTQTGQTTMVSVDSAGIEANGDCQEPSLSADGRYVSYSSTATNLVSGDTNGCEDVFVYDSQSGQTTRVSVDTQGGQGNFSSRAASISLDGKHVAFESHASNLVTNDNNVWKDCFLHNMQTGETSLVSVSSSGAQGDAASYDPAVSSNGRFVAFGSYASNLIVADTNNAKDAFVYDSLTAQTSRVSVDSAGAQAYGCFFSGPSISADGRYVAFDTPASIAPSDTNFKWDIYVHDRQTGQTTLESRNSSGVVGNEDSFYPAMSSDGSYVALQSRASNLVAGDGNGYPDVFLHKHGPDSPYLTKMGTCPGIMTLTVNNATANKNVAFVYGPLGNFAKPTPPCQGLSLSIAQPKLGAYVVANAAGTAVLNFFAPPSVCGLTVQAVDVPTCTATNTIIL